MTRAVLGEGALQSATAQIHPFLIAGWCGIVGTALNCLPVGCIDGGRMMQVTILFLFSPFFPLLFSPLRHQTVCLPPRPLLGSWMRAASWRVVLTAMCFLLLFGNG